MHLAGKEMYRRQTRSRADEQARERLLREARDMLRRVVQLDAPPMRHAWAWFNLGEVLRSLHAPRHEIVEALEQAVRLNPGEARFQRSLARVQTTGR